MIRQSKRSNQFERWILCIFNQSLVAIYIEPELYCYEHRPHCNHMIIFALRRALENEIMFLVHPIFEGCVIFKKIPDLHNTICGATTKSVGLKWLIKSKLKQTLSGARLTWFKFYLSSMLNKTSFSVKDGANSIYFLICCFEIYFFHIVYPHGNLFFKIRDKNSKNVPTSITKSEKW